MENPEEIRSMDFTPYMIEFEEVDISKLKEPLTHSEQSVIANVQNVKIWKVNVKNIGFGWIL